MSQNFPTKRPVLAPLMGVGASIIGGGRNNLEYLNKNKLDHVKMKNYDKHNIEKQTNLNNHILMQLDRNIQRGLRTSVNCSKL